MAHLRPASAQEAVLHGDNAGPACPATGATKRGRFSFNVAAGAAALVAPAQYQVVPASGRPAGHMQDGVATQQHCTEAGSYPGLAQDSTWPTPGSRSNVVQGCAAGCGALGGPRRSAARTSEACVVLRARSAYLSVAVQVRMQAFPGHRLQGRAGLALNDSISPSERAAQLGRLCLVC